jgi:Ca2+-binding RTX toxin-like protein
MVGNFGNDIYYVDDVGDVTTEFSAGDGLDTVKSSVTYTLAQFVDNLTLTGSANLGGTGNGDANKIIGNSGANQLSGLGGNDILDGRSGADHMLGGTGSDTYYVDNAGDVVDETGGDGIDKINSSISLSLVASAQVVGSVENLTPTGGNQRHRQCIDNVIMGNTGNNTLNGGVGNDRLSGVGGNDILIGGTGSDCLTGGLNADAFTFQALGDSTVAADAISSWTSTTPKRTRSTFPPLMPTPASRAIRPSPSSRRPPSRVPPANCARWWAR